MLVTDHSNNWNHPNNWIHPYYKLFVIVAMEYHKNDYIYSSIMLMIDICFQTLTIMNKDMIDIVVRITWWAYMGYLPIN